MLSQEYKQSYYKGENFEAFQVMDWFMDELQGVNAFYACNVIKYLLRYDSKGTPIQDLKKAIYYASLVSVEITEVVYQPALIEPIINDFRRNKNDLEQLWFAESVSHFLKAIYCGYQSDIDEAITAMKKLKGFYQ